jgi:hypothetical protein
MTTNSYINALMLRSQLASIYKENIIYIDSYIYIYIYIYRINIFYSVFSGTLNIKVFLKIV